MSSNPHHSQTIPRCGSILTVLEEEIDPASGPVHLSVGFFERSRAAQLLFEQGKQLVELANVSTPLSHHYRRPLLFQLLVQPSKLFANSESIHRYLNLASMFMDRADEVLPIQLPCQDNDPV